MPGTFYFYDLETTGINAKWSRIMQFAGQRTDQDLNPIGEPHSLLIRLSDDVLPEPEAIMITGITPQQTKADGITEAEFLRIFQLEVAQPDTCMAGFNTLRFDDEFMRYTLWRNYHDPYEREWQDGRTRWDVIDLVRMTRALRPEGIEWPTDSDGRATNRLELLTKANGFEHNAHEALSDVRGTIAIAKLIKDKQPKLFDHYLSMRDKRRAGALLNLSQPQPVVHTSGRFGSEVLATSVVIPIGAHPRHANEVLVYDLRFDPTAYADLSVEDLRLQAFGTRYELEAAGKTRLPVKSIKLNRSPAIAPMGVLDESSQARIKLTLAQVEAHKAKLAQLTEFRQRLVQIWDAEFPEKPEEDAGALLYGGFVNDGDRAKLRGVQKLTTSEVESFEPQFSDRRLNDLWLSYKARNYPATLSSEEQQAWDQYRSRKLSRSDGPLGFKQYFKRLEQLAANPQLPESKRFLLEELYLYGQSIAPFENEALF